MGAITFYVDGIPVVVDDRTYSLDSTQRPVSPAAFRGSGDPVEIWRTQPAIRIVTEFLATNIAQVPLHAFQRAGNGDRKRLDRSDPLSQLLRSPDTRKRQTPFDWMRTLVLDVCLFDRYCAQVFVDDVTGGFRMLRLPPMSWRFVRDVTGAPASIAAVRKDGTEFTVPLDRCLWIDGFPSDVDTSPMASLAGLLAEDRMSAEFRMQLLQNGGRWAHWVERPVDAPHWTTDDQARLKEGLAAYAGSGARAGAVPVFEEGMKLHSIEAGVTPEKGQQLETRKFTLALVANAYLCPPEMFMGGTYNSVAARREQLYGDVLGAWFRRLGDAINVRLLPIVTEVDEARDVYAEFNVHEKMRMAFLDQARLFQTMAGGPVMTRAEARQRLNLEYIAGTDELIVPLNVTEGGQASPTDSGSQNEGPQNATSQEWTYV